MLAGLGIPLGQLVPLLSDFSGLILILSCPHRQILKHLLGILRVPMGFGCPQLETGRLLGQGSQLGHPLLGDSKLGAHIPAQSGLFIKADPFLLLLLKEPGLLPATSDKGLKEDQCQT